MHSPRHSPSRNLKAKQTGVGERRQQQVNASASGGASSSPSPPRTARSQSHGRTDFSTSLPMENIQSLNAAYNAGPVYIAEGIVSAVPSNLTTGGRSSPNSSGRSNSMSPKNSPSNSRSSSFGSSQGFVSSSSVVDQGQDIPTNMAFYPPGEELRQVRDSMLLDLQAQLREMQRENAILKQDLETKEAKLSSSMNSIKTFWSPELKKERALRKDESSKLITLKEQCRSSMDEKQQLSRSIQQLQEELQKQQTTSQVLNPTQRQEADALRVEKERQSKELFLLRKTLEEMEIRIDTQKQTLASRDESIKKLLEMLQSKGLAVKGIEANHEEMDRLRTKLVEAETKVIQVTTSLEQKQAEIANLADDLRRNTNRTDRLERQLGSALHSDSDSSRGLALKAVVEVKDNKIASLEQRLRDQEEELSRYRTSHSLSSDDAGNFSREAEEFKGQARHFKIKIDKMKVEMTKKDSEIQGLQTRLDTLNHQDQDSQAHIQLLKESLSAKEQRIVIMQADIEALRGRLEEKESLIQQKNDQLSNMSTDKNKHSNEVAELREMVDIKDRKTNVLQRKLADYTNALELKDGKLEFLLIKIDNLTEQLNEKEMENSAIKSKLSSLQADQTSTDSAVTSLEEALAEKERMIVRLKDQRSREDNDRTEEVQHYQNQLKESKARLESLEKELADKEASLMNVKEHASSMVSTSLKKDSKITTLEINLAQKTEELIQLESELEKLEGTLQVIKDSRDRDDRQKAKMYEEQIANHREEYKKTQVEVDRLLAVIKEMESEKNGKDVRISELDFTETSGQLSDLNRKYNAMKRDQQMQKKKSAQLLEAARKREGELTSDSQELQVKDGWVQLSDLNRKYNAMKRDQQMQKKKSAQLLEAARKREGELTSDSQELQELMKHKDDRIEELEEALKESVYLTADRETMIEQQQYNIRQLEKQIEKLSANFDSRQEALAAAIAEKDTNMALLELRKKNPKVAEDIRKLSWEKEALVKRLKEETQRCVKHLHSLNESENLIAQDMKSLSPEQAVITVGDIQSVTL
ncbi:ELKS/Rab6-interacting/CAST family member 1-like [Anneissia japonica]|uniref:ELKS/Rab6-interacting/CAST family member 1-like n=1 Tax=Anneissia japonica TaxID=1529436 RepID=UPI00142581A0|nr:ELKS/Rab6-interacting/CAST family member 1-like [Anneissia japonica]